jgi:hypothetical protein
MSFKNLQRGDKVRFLVYANGRFSPPVERVARVNPLLIFPDHVVVNYGTFGTVVDDRNFVRKMS